MYKLILASRYLFRRRIAYFAVLAVALCVFIVAVVMTVLTGLVRDFKHKNHQFVGDCVVATDSLVGFPYYQQFIQLLEQQDFVQAVSPVVKSYALLSPRGRNLNVGVEIMGVDPVRHSNATGFAESLFYHRDNPAEVFVPPYDPNLLGCVLGIDLALQRDAHSRYAYTPSPVRVAFAISCFPLTTKGALAKAGAGLVNTQLFYYSDHSQSGLARVDSSLVYLPLEKAQQLCGMTDPLPRINAIHIRFKPAIPCSLGCRKVAALWEGFKHQQSSRKYAYLLDSVTVQSWKEYRRSVIAAMEKEQTVMTVMFGLVGITTVFIVFVVFYMIVSHKRKDIGILKSLGVSNVNVLALFSGFALLVGLVGSALGLLGAQLFLRRINNIEDWLFERFGFQLWDRTIYAIGEIPSQPSLEVFAVIVAAALLACLAGAWVPSTQAARLNPVEALRPGQL